MAYYQLSFGPDGAASLVRVTFPSNRIAFNAFGRTRLVTVCLGYQTLVIDNYGVSINAH
ncbi:hypothetical protein D3C77_691790 [compost metagenome]